MAGLPRLGVMVDELSLQEPQAISNLPIRVNPVLAVTEGGNGDLALGDPKPGEEREFEIAPGVKMKFCWIPAGKAQLGSPKAEQDYVTKTFYDGKRLGLPGR